MPLLFSFFFIFKSEVRPYLVKCILYIEIKNSRNLNRLFANLVAEDQCCKPVKKIVWQLTMFPFRKIISIFISTSVPASMGLRLPPMLLRIVTSH